MNDAARFMQPCQVLLPPCKARAPPEEAAGGKRPRITRALELGKMPTTVLNLRGVKPLEALELLRRNLPSDPDSLAEWRGRARVAAVMGSCPRSLSRFISGIVQHEARTRPRICSTCRPEALDTAY